MPTFIQVLEALCGAAFTFAVIIAAQLFVAYIEHSQQADTRRIE